jgi:hypothetical protein
VTAPKLVYPFSPEMKRAWLDKDAARIAELFPVIGGTPPVHFWIKCPLCGGPMEIRASAGVVDFEAVCQ